MFGKIPRPQSYARETGGGSLSHHGADGAPSAKKTDDKLSWERWVNARRIQCNKRGGGRGDILGGTSSEALSRARKKLRRETANRKAKKN